MKKDSVTEADSKKDRLTADNLLVANEEQKTIRVHKPGPEYANDDERIQAKREKKRLAKARYRYGHQADIMHARMISRFLIGARNAFNLPNKVR